MSPVLPRPAALLLFVWRLTPSAGHQEATEDRGSAGSQHAFTGDYSQFIDKYAAAYARGSSPEHAPSQDLKTDVHDYARGVDHYMHEADRYADKYSPSKLTGTFEDYTKRYNHVGAQSTLPVPAEAAPSYEQFLASFSADMVNLSQVEHSGFVAPVRNTSDSSEWAAYFKGKYASGYEDFNFSKELQDYKDKYSKQYEGYKDKYMKEYQNYKDKYAKEYSHQGPSAKPSEIHNITELKAWREAALQKIKSYVPKQFRSYSDKTVEQTYEKNKARIEEEEKVASNSTHDANSTHTPKAEPSEGLSLQPTILEASAGLRPKADTQPVPVAAHLDVTQAEGSSQSLKLVLGMASAAALAGLVSLNVVLVRLGRRGEEEEGEAYAPLPEP